MSQMSDQTKEAIDQINGMSRRSFLKAASGLAVAASVGTGQIGRASCRERV